MTVDSAPFNSTDLNSAKQGRLINYLLFLASGATFSLASYYINPTLSVTSCLLSAVLMSVALRRSEQTGGAKGGAFLLGLSFHFLSFYWLPQTLSNFGGFPWLVSFLLHLLFVSLSSLQFYFFAWLFLRLNKSPLAPWGLALATAYLIPELLLPRLFPWRFANPLIGWSTFSGLAEYFGLSFLSFLCLWWIESLQLLAFRKAKKGLAMLTAGSMIVVLCASLYRNMDLTELERNAAEITVALVQGNLSTKEKGNVNLLVANLERYQELSEQALAQGAELIIWPESVMNRWTPAWEENLRNSKYDPAPKLNAPLIYGTLSFELDQTKSNARFAYNAALGINSEGQVLGRYYKKVLMPFGEYLPFADIFPVLKELSPYSGDFSSGTLSTPIPFLLKQKDGQETELKAGLQICYEDLIPGLSLESASSGANILVNLANDAWYGDSFAPLQHHLLASWRAIESGRYLLRSTNTGYTAAVDPRGRTIAALDTFSEGFILVKARLLSKQTLYAKVGELPLFLLLFCLLTIGLRKRP